MESHGNRSHAAGEKAQSAHTQADEKNLQELQHELKKLEEKIIALRKGRTPFFSCDQLIFCAGIAFALFGSFYYGLSAEKTAMVILGVILTTLLILCLRIRKRPRK